MTSNLTMRIDKDLRKSAEDLFSELGMSLSTACTIFLRQAVREHAIPFRVTTHSSDARLEQEIKEAERDIVPKICRTMEEFMEEMRKVDSEARKEASTPAELDAMLADEKKYITPQAIAKLEKIANDTLSDPNSKPLTYEEFIKTMRDEDEKDAFAAEE